jgi:single-stranded-DNA-specific exonuclease
MKSSKSKRWEVIYKGEIPNANKQSEEIIDILLKNRGIKSNKEKQEFFKPKDPQKIRISELGIDQKALKKAIIRIQKAKKNKEKIIIYGDYDADGICASAILWEVLYSLKFDVVPYIPERFSEGYGLNAESIKKLKKENPNLKIIITVDNGIVADKAIDVANKLEVDVIITDHHQKGKKLPKAFSIIHTDRICGSAIAWMVAREMRKEFSIGSGLDLVAIGTIADQMPLIGLNRSFAKYGLKELNRTKRPGLNSLIEEAGLKKGNIGSYAVGFIIAPRLNAMGRLEHALDSLRLLCTKNNLRAKDLAILLSKVNSQRQKVVEKVLVHAKAVAIQKSARGILILSHESYHEGVIGLAAAKLVDEFYRPAIVLSKGIEISKASARSIPGFNIIEFIHKYDDFLEGGGGHPMAAGFSIRTENIEKFSTLAEEESLKILTDKVTTRVLKADLEIHFDQINRTFFEKLKEFEPTGLGNPTPTFVTRDVETLDVRLVGIDNKHLKLGLKKNKKTFSAIAFAMAEKYNYLSPEKKIDVAYNIEENVWNGRRDLELKIKDIKIKE